MPSRQAAAVHRGWSGLSLLPPNLCAVHFMERREVRLALLRDCSAPLDSTVLSWRLILPPHAPPPESLQKPGHAFEIWSGELAIKDIMTDSTAEDWTVEDIEGSSSLHVSGTIHFRLSSHRVSDPVMAA